VGVVLSFEPSVVEPLSARAGKEYETSLGAIESLCKETEALTGGSHTFWIEAADGSVVAGEAVNKTKRVAKTPLRFGGLALGQACAYGKDCEAWVKVCCLGGA